MSTIANIHTAEGMAFAVQWTNSLVAMMNEGARWAIPRSSAIYTIYPSKKIAVRIINDDAVDEVFKAMGWEIREEL